MIYNEYDKLQTVMLGKMLTPALLKHFGINSPAMEQLHQETNEDLDDIQKFLESKGVKVYRPNIEVAETLYEKYGITNSPGSVRDWCFAYGNTVIVCNLSLEQRLFEPLFWEEAFSDMSRQGKTIKRMPRENILADYQHFQDKVRYLGTLRYRELKEKTRALGINLDKTYQGDSDSYRFLIYQHLQEYSLFHAASCFKHNDTIFSGPLGTTKGYKWFFDTLYKVNPNLNPVIFNFAGHIDGSNTILDKDRMLTAQSKWYNNAMPASIKVPRCKHNPLNLTGKNLQDYYEIIANLNGDRKLQYYFKNLVGYDQRVDFDLNGIAIEPNNILCTIFNPKLRKKLHKRGVIVNHIPLRHRTVISGGIHCFTSDIDRSHP